MSLILKTINFRIFDLKNWNLLMTLIYCLHFFFVTKECSKNNALLSSVIPHAKSLTNFVNFNENLEEVPNVCKTLAKKIGEP